MGDDAKPQGASNRRNIVWVSIAAVVGVLFVIGLVTGEEEAPAAEPAAEEPAERPAAPAKGRRNYNYRSRSTTITAGSLTGH